MTLPHLPHNWIYNRYLILCLIFATLLAGMSVFFILSYTNEALLVSEVSKKSIQVSSVLTVKQKSVDSLERQIASLTSQYSNLQNTTTATQITSLQNQISTINDAFTAYSNTQASISTAKNKGVNTDQYNTQLSNITSELLAQKFSNALQDANSLNTTVTNAINQAVIAQAPKPTPTPAPQNLSGSSFNTTTISAQGNNYSVYYISIDLSSPGLRITTDTANTSDCGTNCPVSDLMTYYSKNSGFAAINGTYFCPVTYSSCSSDTNSFDFPVYNSNLHKWINQGNLAWNNRAMMTFNGTSVTFYPNAASYAGASINAGFVMAPGLVQNGQVIVGNYPLDTKSATADTTRGAMGIKGNNLIIADSFGLTVPQMAYVMQAMGVSNAIGLDGGGSTAMIYNGQYKLGPGRNIPNAIIFSRN